MSSNDTKDRIIFAAIVLFNRDGVANVRSRHVSDHLGISNGNLTYHFPTMADLVDAVVGRLIGSGARAQSPDSAEPMTLPEYAAALERIVEIQRTHSFFYKDVLEIIRRYPEAGARYRALLAARWRQGRNLLRGFVENGTLRREVQAGTYGHLQIAILSTMLYWMTNEELLGREEALRVDPRRMVLDLLHPHLTPRGRRQYRSITDPPEQP